jgi:uncharacterized protein YkwD
MTGGHMLRKSLYLTLSVLLLLTACGKGTVVTVTQVPTKAIIIAPTTEVPPTAIEQSATSTIAPAKILPTNLPNCTDQAAFVADVSIPDNTKFNANAKFIKTWRIKNTGTCAWNSKYWMVFSSGYKMESPDFVELSDTAPGQTLDVSVNLTAPDKRGTANSFFELHNPVGNRLPIDTGLYLYVTIYVNPDIVGTTPTSGINNAGVASTPNATAIPGAACAYTADPSKVADVIESLNVYRAQNGLVPLVVNPFLTQAAQAHSADMACKNLFTHTGSDGSTIATRIAATGYNASGSTENVYGSFPPLTGQGVVSWWANDKTDLTHNKNLLTTKYSEIGVSYSFFNNFGYYVVDFASP